MPGSANVDGRVVELVVVRGAAEMRAAAGAGGAIIEDGVEVDRLDGRGSPG